MSAKRLFAIVLACSSPLVLPAQTANSWLTIVGSQDDPAVDTILIDPTTVAPQGNLRFMSIRLNRAGKRNSTDGISFRSFESEVEFDCARRSARFTKTQFYDGPSWTLPGRLINYSSTTVRSMDFRGIEPNPKNRLISAACGVRAR